MEDVYWKFANERLRIYKRSLLPNRPQFLTKDPILHLHRFTNAYRAADRVSQKLISIQYENPDDDPKQLFFKTLLFKLFNKLETWDLITASVDPHTRNIPAIRKLLKDKAKIYSAAYIQASPGPAGQSKADAHLDLLQELIDNKFYTTIARAKSLQEVYNLLKTIRSFGDFLAFQYTIDLNYSTLVNFSEHDFVVPGPGCIDGVSKIFPGMDPRVAIRRMTDKAPARMNDDLFGRELHPIDCQNLFCEISKYTRLSHPDIIGSSGRTTIKQKYHRRTEPLPLPVFPPKWNITVK